MYLTLEEKNLVRKALSKYHDDVLDQINDSAAALAATIGESEPNDIVSRRQAQLADLDFWKQRSREINELYEKVGQL